MSEDVWTRNAGQVVRTPPLRRRLFLHHAAVAFSAVLAIAVCLISSVHARAQSAAASPAPGIAGTWQGTLHAGQDLRTVVKITKADDGTLKATFYSIDQGPGGMPVTTTTLQGSDLKLTLTLINGSYEGKLSADGNSITGTWTQGANSLPLNFARATPETAWAIPEPAPPLPAMAADADPEFEAATIKPSAPGAQGKGFGVRGRNFSTKNTSLADLIEFAYDVHATQIVGGPAWLDEDKYDLAAVPDKEGTPSYEQWKSMVQKLLADRFQLKFHRDKKVLSVYVLTVGKGGPKNVTKSENPAPGFSIPIMPVAGGVRMLVRNGTMTNFAVFGLQGAVLDRPVLDQTGLKDRFDFALAWAPDQSQFGGHFREPPDSTGEAPPDLYSAIQQQLGLKLEATKAPADVLVIDHVEKPSPN